MYDLEISYALLVPTLTSITREFVQIRFLRLNSDLKSLTIYQKITFINRINLYIIRIYIRRVIIHQAVRMFDQNVFPISLNI